MLLASMEENVPITSYFFIVGDEDTSLDMFGRARQPWERLLRVALPWTAPTATLAIESVARALDYDDRAWSLVLRGARLVCESGQADLGLLDSLTSAIARLDTLQRQESGIAEMSGLARRVVAAATPPDLLDLSLLAGGDEWAAPAREAARSAPAQEVAPLIRLLGALGPRKPTQRWLREVGDALASPAPASLLRAWLELAAFTDIVPEWPDSDLCYCRGTLFVGTNTDLVRAAVWATSQLPQEAWAAGLLGTLARRGAAHNGLAGHPEALSLKVATAAVDALIARGRAVDRRVLGDLLEDLQRRDLVKKVGEALDRVDEATERDAELRRTKAQELRRRASPAPRKARAAMDSLIRHYFGADLRALGFKGGPRTWRRMHEDRVDIVSISTFTDGANQTRLYVGYGTRYVALHPPDEPWPIDPNKVVDHQLDIRLSESSTAEEPLGELDLAETLRRLKELAVPFLDGLGEYEFAKAVLERDAHIPAGAFQELGPMGSPARRRLLGQLAAANGEA